MSKLGRVKALPWALLLQAGVLAGNRWRSLSAKDRQRLSGLVRSSRGWPGNLSARERAELKKLISKLDVKAVGGDLLSLAGNARKGRKRR